MTRCLVIPSSNFDSTPSVFPSRFIWNYIRLENEHLYNCGRFRATRDIHLNALSPHQERMLQSMMVERADDSGSENNSYRHHLAKEYF